jgi:FeS assembly SUF system protein
MNEEIVKALKTCYDPEIPVNIWELGLIYDVKADPAGAVDIKMTLTSPNCPVAGSLPREVESKIRAIPGVTDVKLELVWEPPWTPAKMSDAAKLALGMDLDAPMPGPDGLYDVDTRDPRSR